MIHLSEWQNPHEKGLKAFQCSFTLLESAPVRSMLEEGIVYRHPENRLEAIVWAKDVSSIEDVLWYHYRERWKELEITVYEAGQ